MKFGTKSVLVKDGKVLLIKRSSYNNYRVGEWDLPGGRLEPNEKIFEGHKREIMEETKLVAEIIEPVRCWVVTRNNEKHVGITFLSKHKQGNVILSDEHTEFKWLEVNEIQNIISESHTESWIKKEILLAKKLNPNLFTKGL